MLSARFTVKVDLGTDLCKVPGARWSLHIEDGLLYRYWCTLKEDWCIVLFAQYSVHIEGGLRHGSRCTLDKDWCMVLSAY